ncbi:MAG: formate/nitrite transporter family protein [Ruminococcus sp.]|nr:formate/nitrite transporter family protein [Ruminococcus sp.]
MIRKGLIIIFDVFVKAILAGLSISIGGTVFLSVESRPLGAFLFAVGLFAILTRGFKLFTGAIGYFWERDKRFKLECLVIWAGNFAGTFLGAILINLTRISAVSEKASALVDVKLADTPLSVFILAIFCGMLMYIAVHGWNTAEKGAVKIIACIVPVAVFILCGFEHCIANMYYFSLAFSFANPTMWLYLLLMTLGNAVGAWILSVPPFILSNKAVKNP